MKTSVLVPAHNEAAYLPACLDALLASDADTQDVEVIVMANGCSDDTAAVAQGFAPRFEARDWRLRVLDLAQGGKLNALNEGEAIAAGSVLIYVDADVTVSPALIGQITAALDVEAPRYASGRPHVTVPGGDPLTKAYTRFWVGIPFMTEGIPGFGVFAMNRAGRARWGAWPDIISDDTFARLSFRPEERISVPATFDWPMIEGFRQLVQVRRRQNVGVAEIAEGYPALMANEDDHARAEPTWRRAFRDPLAFAAFALVRLTVRLPIFRSKTRWTRGR